MVFTYDSLDGAKNALKKLKNKTLSLSDEGDYQEDLFDKYNELFKDAISNDLNTSSAITVLYDVLKDDELSDTTKKELVKSFDKVLSLDLFAEESKNIDSVLEKKIQEKIEERALAKKNKDFAKADAIRDELLANGVKLIDSRDGTSFELI